MGLHIKRKIKHIGHSAKKTVKKTGKNIKNAVKHPVKSIKKCAKKVFNGLGRALSYTSGIVLNPLFSVGALLASKQLANNQILSFPSLQNISIMMKTAFGTAYPYRQEQSLSKSTTQATNTPFTS